MKAPDIDKRDVDDIIDEIRAMAPYYVPELDLSGEKGPEVALIRMFAHLMKQVIDRLNQVPDKNFIAFLELLGLKLLPALPARAPVTFKLSEGVTDHVLIPKESQIAAKDVIFETEKDMMATPAKLVEVYSVDPEKDAIYRSPSNVISGEQTIQFKTKLINLASKGANEILLEKTEGLNEGDTLIIDSEYVIVSKISNNKVVLSQGLDSEHSIGVEVVKIDYIELFTGKNHQEHVLYLGHDDLFNLENESIIELQISPKLDESNFDDMNGLFVWEYSASQDPDTKQISWKKFLSVNFENKENYSSFTLTKCSEKITKVEINGNQSRWIRCKVKSNINENHDIKIKGLQGHAKGFNYIYPDMAFYNDIPLEMAKTLYENYFSLLKYDIGQDFYLFHQVGPDIRGTIVSDDELEIINFLNKNKFISNSICSINVKNESKLFYVLGSKTEQSERFFTGWKYKTLDNARKVVKFLIKTKIFFASVCCINIKERKLFYVFYQEETNPEDVTWTYKQFDSVDKVFNFLNNNEFINVSVCPINNKESISFIVFYLLQKKSSNINLSFKCFNSSEKLNEFINRKNSHLIKPFGNKPKILDTFYIGSNDAFSKKGAKILLNIRRDHPYPSGTKEEPSLSWEYWNGNSWTAIRDLNDNTENFTAESMKTAEFLCPADIESNTVNGQENFWIRVRIVDGTFGEFLEYDPLNEIFKYDPKTLYPPKITELNIQYEYLKFQALEYCLSFNNLEFKDFSEEIKAGNKPFIKTDDKHQTIYFGFDQKLEKGPINLFFDIEEYPWISNDQTLKWEYYNENGDWTGFDALDGTYGFTRSGTVEFYIPKDFIKTRKFGKELYWIRAVDVNYKFQSSREEFEIKLAQLINTYDENPDVIPPELPKMLKLADVYNIKTIKNPSYAGNALLKSESENKLKIKDNREILNEIVLDKISINLEKKEISISKLEDQINPCVSEIELDHPEWSSSKLESFNPHIRGIYLNTTWGVQWETIKDEILGSSDGTEMQTFKLLKNTVISEELWVNEINSISEAEIQKIKEKNEFKVIETKDEKGNLTEFWVNWKPVDDILLAENERFYEIDHYSGELKFGNEISGKIPPIGRNNLKITYRTGGGSKGNLPVNEIKDLKSSIAFVDKAYNPLPAGGGSDVEDISNLLDRGPKILKNRNRAVTTEDFEEITRQASREVAKVKCLSNFDNKGEISSGWVTLLVIPQSEEEKPVLSFGLKNRIEEYLHDHAANTLNLQVSAPLYVSVSTTVTLKTESARIVPQVEKETFKTLSQFLNPLKGGYNSRGWDFGKMPCISDFYSILEKIEGIDHVSELSVLFKTDQGDEYPLEPGKMADFQLTPYCMIYSGEHLVKVEPGDDV